MPGACPGAAGTAGRTPAGAPAGTGGGEAGSRDRVKAEQGATGGQMDRRTTGTPREGGRGRRRSLQVGGAQAPRQHRAWRAGERLPAPRAPHPAARKALRGSDKAAGTGSQRRRPATAASAGRRKRPLRLREAGRGAVLEEGCVVLGTTAS